MVWFTKKNKTSPKVRPQNPSSAKEDLAKAREAAVVADEQRLTIIGYSHSFNVFIVISSFLNGNMTSVKPTYLHIIVNPELLRAITAHKTSYRGWPINR